MNDNDRDSSPLSEQEPQDTTAEELSPEECCRRAQVQLERGDPQEAFRLLQPVIEFPANPDEPLFREALAVFAGITEAITGEGLSRLVHRVIQDPADGDALYAAAYALFEEQLHGVSALFLSRAHAVAPHRADIVTELVANLQELFMHERAAEILEESGLIDQDPMCLYLYGYQAMLCGALDVARPIAEGLSTAEDAELAEMGGQLLGMVRRADALAPVSPMNELDVSGFHLAINGTLLLHVSPHGYPNPMGGRYAYVSDSYGLLGEGVERLGWVLDAAGMAFPRVIALPDRSSQVLGRAVARVLGVPCEIWSPTVGELSGLLVAYDLSRIEDDEVIAALAEHREGQLLFVHASCWTDPFPFAPDITTYLYETNVAPWDEGRLHYDESTRAVARGEADDSSVETLQALIQPPAEGHQSVSQREQLLAQLAAVQSLPAPHAAGVFRRGGVRLRQRKGSPVQSSRFS